MRKNTFQTYNSQVHEPVASSPTQNNSTDRTPQSDRPTDRQPHTDCSPRDDGTPLADGGIEWTDLTAFQLDLLAAIAAPAGEPCYGIAVERKLAEAYTGLNAADCYHHLNSLVARGLVTKSDPDQGTALDRRTSTYRLSDRGRTLVETQARWLVTSCGLEPRLDGGERR